VVGILPDGFRFLQPDFELWMPLSVDERFNARDDHSVMVFGRLAAGVSVAQARSELDSIASGLERTHPDTNAGWGVRIIPIYPTPFANARSLRSALLILFGAVGLVVLIACANVANLLLARATLRRREFAIRAAIGASRLQLVRQMLAESVVLAIAGGGLALVLARWGLRAVTPLLPGIPAYRMLVPVLDGRVFLFTLGIALLNAVAFGLPPAFQATNYETLRLSASSARALRGGRVLMICELALSIVLLVGAALLVKSLWRLQNVPPGFQQDHLLTMQVSLPKTKYPDRSSISNFYQEALRRLDGLPGVASAGAVSFRPFLGWADVTLLDVQGRPRKAGEQAPAIEYRVVSPGYLRMLGVPFMRGRDLAEGDGPDAAGAVVVNQTTARRLWPNENPIGKQIRPRFGGPPIPWRAEGDPRERWLTVVGVAGNIKEERLNDREHAEIYLSYRQFPSAFMFLVMRTHVAPETLSSAVRGAVLAVDHDQPVSDIRTMDSAIRDSTAGPRLNAELLVLFVMIALLLSAAGVYGVMSYLTNQRVQEMGIRMALGARPNDILLMVLREIATLAVTAAITGLIVSAWLTRMIKSVLFEVAPIDPAIFAGASLVLFAVALAACYLPARRAARVDAMTALRL
jgi:putative ABC transport system permease protein